MYQESLNLFETPNEASRQFHVNHLDQVDQVNQANTTNKAPKQLAIVKSNRRAAAASGPAVPARSGKAKRARIAPPSGVDHLAAARRLQRRLRKAPVRSPEEIRAGRLICRHLVALLQASES